MKVFIAIINHNHDDMIITNPSLIELAQNFSVIVKSNTIASHKLSDYCKKNNITLIQGKNIKGFGANNNDVFKHLKINNKIKPNDYFLVLNPDVEVLKDNINRLIDKAERYKSHISSINLYTDKNYSNYDNSIRRYPELLAPVKSLLGMKRLDLYDKSIIKRPIKVDWASGSFLFFKASCFEELGGFDESYFMYFEDADICTRANKNGFNLYYFPSIKAIHFASHQNRNLFSKHFFWYWKSSLNYHLNSKNQINMK